MKNSANSAPSDAERVVFVEQWIPLECTCRSTIAEISSDRNWLRFLCRDRRHGGKVYSYVDLRHSPNDRGVIEALVDERLGSNG